jgi:hypothetical protein
MAGDGHWMGRDGEFWRDTKSREARLATPHRSAFIFVIFAFSRFISAFPRSESNLCFRLYRGAPCGPYLHCIHGSAPAGREVIPPSRPSPSGEGGQRSGRLPATGAVQYPDCCPTVHHSFWSEAKLSRPLARTAEWIVFRGNARPVVAVANRIGHTRRPVLRKVSSSGTRPEKAAQGGVLPILCGSINVPYECNPVGRSGRDVPFLTGQKGDGKSRRAGRAAADGSALRRGHESVTRFATCPSATQSRPRRHTAKGPEIENRRRGSRWPPLVLFYCEKGVDRGHPTQTGTRPFTERKQSSHSQAARTPRTNPQHPPRTIRSVLAYPMHGR